MAPTDFDRCGFKLPLLTRLVLGLPSGAYALGGLGHCIGPISSRTVAMVNPRAEPKPGDLVAVAMAAPPALRHIVTPARDQVIAVHESELSEDPEIRELAHAPGNSILRPEVLLVGKFLVEPLPPVSEWSTGRHSLVVEQLVEPWIFRIPLAQVLAVDKVARLVDLTNRLRRLPVRRPAQAPLPTQSRDMTPADMAWGWGHPF